MPANEFLHKRDVTVATNGIDTGVFNLNKEPLSIFEDFFFFFYYNTTIISKNCVIFAESKLNGFSRNLKARSGFLEIRKTPFIKLPRVSGHLTNQNLS